MDGFEERLVDEMRKYAHPYDPSWRDFKDTPKNVKLLRKIASEDVLSSLLSTLVYRAHRPQSFPPPSPPPAQ